MADEVEYFLEGVTSPVHRFKLGERTIEYWAPETTTDRILIAHDGQCVFDPRSAKKLTTWELVQNSIKVSKELNVTPPLIIGIWHQGQVGDSVARGLDLSPDSYFKSGIPLFPKNGPFDVNATKGDQYLSEIFTSYLPEVLGRTNATYSAEKTAMIGASRGALSTLYALKNHSGSFHTALAHSTHWTIGKYPLVELTIAGLPDPGKHKIWMAHGTEGFDSEYGEFQDHAHKLLLEKGYSFDRDLSFTLYQGDAHTEAAWATQAADSLRFWITKSL
jgi:predicted alpha/beta superfamily hydrolase